MSDLIAINAGAFNLAIQALKRAGKDEIAEQLESDCECVPDLIEQQQARIAELSERQPEWFCYTCNTVYPFETVKKISDCLCPNGCGEVLKPRSQTERLLEQRIAELVLERDRIADNGNRAVARAIRAEYQRDELAATVERLRDALSSVEEYANGKCFEPAAVTFSRVREALKATPQQNLAEHDAEVARKAFIEGSESLECAQMFGRDYDVEQAANQYAERVKRGES